MLRTYRKKRIVGYLTITAVLCGGFMNCTGVSSLPVESTALSSAGAGGPPMAPTPIPGPGAFPKVGEVPLILSNFAVDPELVDAWGNGAIPASAAPDNVGAFRFICNPSHEAYDDPIVYPGMIGASHLHQFFGNTLANGKSTYESLRTTGASTCNSPLNRSAYWIPAMMNGKGKVVKPDYVSIYYKRMPKTDPNCQKQGKACVDIPRGLRFVFGKTMTGSGTGGYFNCDSKDWSKKAPGTNSAHYTTIIEAAKNCPFADGTTYANNRLGLVINAPDCWDGVNLDSPDHRSHMAFGGYGSWGYYKCPDTHPYVIPTFTLGAWYTVDQDLYTDIKADGTWNGTQNGWHLSSDEMNKVEPGKTVHADWFGAWDDGVMDMWHKNCIDKLLNCSGGDLGNGKQLRNFSGFKWDANPRVVDPPAMTGPMMKLDHSKMHH